MKNGSNKTVGYKKNVSSSKITFEVDTEGTKKLWTKRHMAFITVSKGGVCIVKRCSKVKPRFPRHWTASLHQKTNCS